MKSCDSLVSLNRVVSSRSKITFSDCSTDVRFETALICTVEILLSGSLTAAYSTLQVLELESDLNLLAVVVPRRGYFGSKLAFVD